MSIIVKHRTDITLVAERVGMTEISNYAKYRVAGPGAEAWLSSLLTARMPAPGRITLTAMLNDAGRIVGEFTVARASEADEFHLFGSLPAETHHSRWFVHHLPKGRPQRRTELLQPHRRIPGAVSVVDRAAVGGLVGLSACHVLPSVVNTSSRLPAGRTRPGRMCSPA